MAREINRLSPRGLVSITEAGRHADGGGLYLYVDKSGARRWVFLFRWGGKLKEMGLGGINSVGLGDARTAAADARSLLSKHINPIDHRRSQEADRAAPTFGELSDSLLKDLKPGWKNAKHQAQWEMTLKVYAAGLRSKRPDEITTADVVEVLRPIWSTKPETAARTRGRIERVLDAAKAKGLRSGENPARWRGHLDHLLPKQQKLTRGHHAAMAFDDLPKFMAKLKGASGVSVLALRFTILTAARSGEVYGATWAEIDLEAKVWTIPASRMKAGREHRVPLSEPALEILEDAKKLRTGALVFPGAKKDSPLSNMSMDMALRRLDCAFTVHGFRSTFRDWAGEVTHYPREVAEAALAHVVGDQTERAYRRGDALEKRRGLMDAWARHCTGTAGDVVPFRSSSVK